MAHSTKGLIAGLVATLVLSAVMLLLTRIGLKDADIIALLDRFGSINRAAAWVDHVLIGTAMWGLIFAGFDAVTPKAPFWLKGIVFGAGIWLAMMLLFMPVVGVGLLGLDLGISMPLVMLLLHLVYGATLGITFGFLDAWAPAPSQTPAA